MSKRTTKTTHDWPTAIKRFRQSLDMGLTAFTEYIGARSKMTVWRWEHGKNPPQKHFQEKLRAKGFPG